MKEKICGIYKITSPSNRVYVGQSQDIYKRIKTYKSSLAKYQTKLYNSFRKYGFENHIFEIIMVCEREYLNFYEKQFIKDLNCCDQKKGLNSMTGGDATQMTKELRKKISRIQKKRFKNDPELYKRTVEQIKSVPKSGRDNPIYGTGRSFLKFDLEFNLIKEYKSKFDIIEESPLGAINIYKCCNRHKMYKTVKGFIWRFKDDCLVDNNKLIENISIKKFTKVSKYKGVRFAHKENIWFASYWSSPLKKYLYIGRFKKEIDAHIAYTHFKYNYENPNSNTLLV